MKLRDACLKMIGAMLFVTVDANAYSVKTNSEGNTIRWVDDLIELKLGEGFVEHFGREVAYEAAQMAAAAWSEIPKSPEIRIVDGTVSEFDEISRSNGIFLMKSWVNDEDQLAVTYTSATPAGHIVGVDILINGEMPYSLLKESEYGNYSDRGEFHERSDGYDHGELTETYDLASVLTHEMGHVLGLGECLDHKGATMDPDIGKGEIQQRKISKDDAAGVEEIYSEEIPEVESCAVRVPGASSRASSSTLAALFFGLWGLVGYRRRNGQLAQIGAK